MKIGEILKLSIIDVARGGAGVARHASGRTVFVPYTVSGDIITARVIEIKKKFAHGELIEVITSGADRINPECGVFTRCGGCQWQHIPYDKQWQIKIAGVQQALTSSRIAIPQSIDEFPAQQIWHYRNRVQLRGFQDNLGYYAPRSHDIVPIEECKIARPEINEMLTTVKTQGMQYQKPYKVEIEVLADGKLRTTWNNSHAAAGFRQVNDEQNNLLKHWVASALTSQQAVYDLYGGSANLSWNLAKSGRDICCVDLSVPEQAPDGCPTTLKYYRSDVLPWLKERITDIKFKRVAQPDQPCSAIIDPPRGGLDDKFDDIVERLELLKVNEVIAVGCKTDSWVRDLSRFIQRGWMIHKLAAFDFFPHTIHIESVAHLTRQSC